MGQQSATRVDICTGKADLRQHVDASIVEMLASPIIVVDATGHFFHANVAGRAFLSLGHGLAIDAATNRIAAASLDATRLLHAQITEVACGSDSSTRLGIRIARGDDEPITGLLAAIPPGGLPESAQMVLLTFTDCRLRPLPSAEWLRAQYGLTMAEARTVVGLVTGYTVRKLSEMHDIKIGTVHAHLKASKTKMGARRQVDIVHRTMSSAALISDVVR